MELLMNCVYNLTTIWGICVVSETRKKIVKFVNKSEYFMSEKKWQDIFFYRFIEI